MQKVDLMMLRAVSVLYVSQRFYGGEFFCIFAELLIYGRFELVRSISSVCLYCIYHLGRLRS